MIFQESNMQFTFADGYQIIKSDEQINVNKVKQFLSNTKDIDFFGFDPDKNVLFLEVKNFRGALVEEIEVLANEVAQKLRDTVAIIAGASKNTTNNVAFWQTLHQFIGNPEKKILLVFWLEEDLQTNLRHQNRFKTIQDKLKQKCKWLTTRILIVNQQNPQISGLEVQFLPNQN